MKMRTVTLLRDRREVMALRAGAEGSDPCRAEGMG